MRKSWLIYAVLASALAGCSNDSDGDSGKTEGQAQCGNNVVEADEKCDDGNTSSGDGCTEDCSAIEDGYTCPETGGQCQKDGDNPPKTDKCGDGKVTDGEKCDDGNTIDGDGCTADCKTVENGYTCPENGGKCLKNEDDPAKPVCGDGKLTEDEICDDGNTKDGDGCSADCQTVEDGFTCPTPGYDCIPNTCGDGELSDNEECDDGEFNVDYGYGQCAKSCQFAHYCGDGKFDAIDKEYEEECDDGKDTSSDYNGCTNNCKKVNFCGDGKIQSDHEQCDDGNNTDGDGCSANCTFEPNYTCVTTDGKSVCSPIPCGNGQLDANELCDDGNRENGDGCSAACIIEKGWRCQAGDNGTSTCVQTCGNGELNTDTGEECDDNNTNDGDGCSSNCVIEPGFVCTDGICSARACGDGIVAGNEECDDGNTENDDGCSKFCKREEGWHCDVPGQKCKEDKCGDGIVTGDETCDEGAEKTAGCVDCKVQMGWKCDVPGQKCTAAECGNGILEGAETCEENNECCQACAVQPSCLCDAAGKNCVKGKCGNGIVEAGEQCDDGNDVAGDGCSPLCTIEPIFSCTNGSCKPTCGDGLTLWEAGEECDDGNLTNGDGCSSDCKIESGYSCTKFDGSKPSTLNLPIVYRDFRAFTNDTVNNSSTYTPVQGTVRGFFTQEDIDKLPATCFDPNVYRKRNMPGVGTPIPDFQGNSCYSWNRCANVIYPELNKAGRPVLRPAAEMTKHADANTYFDNAETCAQLYTCPEVFEHWYKDTNMNVTIKTTLPLSKLSDDTYQYTSTSFWPLAGLGFNSSDASVNYGVRDNKSGLFTSEFQSYFKFKGGEVLTFEGDDDVWVFFNGHLALEFAGIHGKWGQTITLTPEKAKAFGMFPGGIYSLQMFHAERCQGGSGYTLTMSGFVNMGTSACETKCGDGLIRGDEECEFLNGENPNDPEAQHKYGCSATCKRQPFCGNGKVETGEGCDTTESWCQNCQIATCNNNSLDEHEQCDKVNGSFVFAGKTEEESKNLSCSNCRIIGCGDGIVDEGEQCDDGNTTNDDACSNTCHLPECGDGIVQTWLGEVCDDGVNDGSYGGCGFGCAYQPPKCGDGIVDKLSGEECDDGTENNIGGYGRCKADCKLDEHCGDGILQEAHEQCEPALNSSCAQNCFLRIN